jgi:DNA-binding XRE family transcriptional regulator
MNKKELSKIRQRLGKSQKEMAQLLAISLKAVQSFEQGWRNMMEANTVGTFKTAPWRQRRSVRHGSSRAGMYAGSLAGQYAMERFKEIGTVR